MSKVEGTRLPAPVGQRPNAQRSGGIATLGPLTLFRTVNVAWVVFVSAASYERKAGLPLRVSVKVPACGRLRSEYSTRIRPTIGLPSGWVAIGSVAARLLAVWTTSPSQPASTIV